MFERELKNTHFSSHTVLLRFSAESQQSSSFRLFDTSLGPANTKSISLGCPTPESEAPFSFSTSQLFLSFCLSTKSNIYSSRNETVRSEEMEYSAAGTVNTIPLYVGNLSTFTCFTFLPPTFNTSTFLFKSSNWKFF